VSYGNLKTPFSNAVTGGKVNDKTQTGPRLPKKPLPCLSEAKRGCNELSVCTLNPHVYSSWG